MTHICVGKLTIISSDNGLSPGRRLAIIWNNAGMFLIGLFVKEIRFNFEKKYIQWHYASHYLLNLKSEFGFLMICHHEIRAEWAKTEIMDPNELFS